MVNTKENPFLFATTPSSNNPWKFPAYFREVHDAPERFKKCQLA